MGIEYNSETLELARRNAKCNFCDNLYFPIKYLYKFDLDFEVLNMGKFNKIVIDPPRSGAADLISYLNLDEIGLAMYVSCNASTN